jgi:predicted PurR-regulated permease PerM
VIATRLWPLVKLLIVSILLAVPLYRLVGWVCRKGWPRWAAILVSMLTLVVAVLSLPALIAPIAINQASDLGKNLPKLQQQLAAKIPPGALRNLIDHAGNLEKDETLQRFSHQALSTIRTTMDALLSLVLITALTVYLIADGPRALQWLITFFPQRQRERVAKGLDKIGGGMVAGIVGAIATLPMVAAYPALESLWLSRQLEPEVVKDHQAQLRAA